APYSRSVLTPRHYLDICRSGELFGQPNMLPYEHHMPLVLTFVDYEKAFDSVETNAILSALVDQGVESSYVNILADCYRHCSTTLQLFDRPLTIPIEKGVRQGDTISPKLFTAAFQWIMKSLDWDERGIRVDGKFS
ncbi:hypothetical protein TELCIR_15202, partial [Teladorsagia circumcincta]